MIRFSLRKLFILVTCLACLFWLIEDINWIISDKRQTCSIGIWIEPRGNWHSINNFCFIREAEPFTNNNIWFFGYYKKKFFTPSGFVWTSKGIRVQIGD